MNRWFGTWRLRTWLLPVVLGIGIGALIFGLPSVLAFGHRGGPQRRFDAAAVAPGDRTQRRTPAAQGDAVQAAPDGSERQRGPKAPHEDAAQSAPAAPGAQAGPQTRQDHGRMTARQDGNVPRREPGRAFFGFGGLSLALPLVLIGSGVWLMTGRRRGPGGQPTLRPNEAETPPVPTPVEPQSTGHREPPVTGETWWL